MRMKIIVILLLVGLSVVQAEIAFHMLWQVPGNVTDIHVADVNENGYQEILLATGSSYNKMISTPAGTVTAAICEGTVSQFEHDGTLIWEERLCKNTAASDPCYNDGCISAIYAGSICITTRKLIFVGCCYCGKSSIVRVYTPEGVLVQELYDRDALGAPVPIPGCVRKILVEDINADNCNDVIVVTNLQLFVYIANCQACTLPVTPTYRTIDLPVANRPSGTINDVIVVNFDDDVNPTKEIVVAADDVTVYEDNLQLKWKYFITLNEPVRAVYAFDLDSDTPAHEIDQDADLEPELIVGESWYIYVLDNMEQGDTNPANDQPNLKWEYSTSPYNVNTVLAGKFIGPRNAMGGSALLVYILDYNGTLLKTFNAPSEVRKLALADFDKDGQNELVVFSTSHISVFSTTEMVWSSESIGGGFLDGVVVDLDLDGTPEIVGGYTSGLYVFGVEELEAVVGSEADQLYDTGKNLKEKGDFMEAAVHFEQARIKYEKTGNTFMTIQCQKQVAECEKFLDTDRVVATAMEQLRNYQYEQASYFFGEAANLYGKMGDKTKMSQMRILKEASEKLWQAHSTLMAAHQLLLDEKYSEASVEATWAQHTFEDVSNLFLTMSLDSIYETLRLEISAKIRECQEMNHLCDQFAKAQALREEADDFAADGDRFFRNQQYSQARSSNDQAKDLYTEAAQILDELQIALGKRADSFRRDVSDIEGKIEILQQSDIYKTYKDAQTSDVITSLEEKKSVYEDLIDEYEDFAESVGRRARDYRTEAVQASNQSSQSYSFADEFLGYARGILEPPTSLAVGLACLIVALVGLAAGKGKYVALIFLILVLIFLGVSALHFLY